MRRILITSLVGLLVGSAALVAYSCGHDPNVRQALSKDEATRAKAIAELREQGPEGLDGLIELRDLRKKALETTGDPTRSGQLIEGVNELNSLIDEVGGAKYCSASKLYWYTDFDKAKAAAARENKPL